GINVTDAAADDLHLTTADLHRIVAGDVNLETSSPNDVVTIDNVSSNGLFNSLNTSSTTRLSGVVTNTALVFTGDVTLLGDTTLQAGSVFFGGGAGSVHGPHSITFIGLDPTDAIGVAGAGGTLQVSAAALAALGSDVTSVFIGNAATPDIQVNALSF